MKYFRLGWKEILWGVSYVNLMMLAGTIPSYNSKKEDKETYSDGADDLPEFLKNL